MSNARRMPRIGSHPANKNRNQKVKKLRKFKIKISGDVLAVFNIALGTVLCSTIIIFGGPLYVSFCDFLAEMVESISQIKKEDWPYLARYLIGAYPFILIFGLVISGCLIYFSSKVILACLYFLFGRPASKNKSRNILSNVGCVIRGRLPLS